MEFDDVFRHCKAQPKAAVVTRRYAFRLFILFETEIITSQLALDLLFASSWYQQDFIKGEY